jgi:hypothetical protein
MLFLVRNNWGAIQQHAAQRLPHGWETGLGLFSKLESSVVNPTAFGYNGFTLA